MNQYKFYARPYGNYIHMSTKCPMLAGAIFKELDYSEITLEEAQKRGFLLCKCVVDKLGITQFTTTGDLIKYLAKEKAK